MMEKHPIEGVKTNIFGTKNVADCAVKYDCQRFVMISTDKAVNPTNVMGCSKRICEIYCQSLNKAIAEGSLKFETANGKKPETQFVTTRFGNVLQRFCYPYIQGTDSQRWSCYRHSQRHHPFLHAHP